MLSTPPLMPTRIFTAPEFTTPPPRAARPRAAPNRASARNVLARAAGFWYNGAVSGFFGIGEFNAEVQDIADYNADGKDDLLFRTASGVVGAALITGADATTWAEYGALGDEWSTKGVGIL